jgi:hypothetical protein
VGKDGNERPRIPRLRLKAADPAAAATLLAADNHAKLIA